MGNAEAGLPTDAGASQPSVALAQAPSCSPLVDLLVKRCSDAVYDILKEAHDCPPQRRVGKEGTSKFGSFSKIVHKLKLAYSANLNQCVRQGASEDYVQSVRRTTELITKKLNDNCDADAAQLGEECMEQMLQNLLKEFHWDACAQIFEECALRARSEKAKAYEHVRAEEDLLKNCRCAGD